MYKLYIPEGYHSLLSPRQTQLAIKKVKDFFERDLAIQLNLTRVSAPLFVDSKSGLNDTLNGVERPVSFDIKGIDTGDVEIVQSLAKWKRLALKQYDFEAGEGLYTDMNAIRRDEDTDNIHSVFVDQWDWEKHIEKSERNEETLKIAVRAIYRALRHTERYVADDYDFVEKHFLPDKITFVTTQELEDMYPELDAHGREDAFVREHKTAFIMQIGGKLKSGKPHDLRAPDYDDWELNGDIMIWNEVLGRSFEISSMGIRVDEESLTRQLELAGCTERREMEFHRMLLEGKLPLTMGGGIGQSRICMLMMQTAHIGEVQASVWDDDTRRTCADAGIILL